MTGVFSSTPYESFAQDLDAAVERISSLGIPYERTRIGEYKRAIDILLEVYTSKDLEKTRREFVRLVTALFEANDLIAIHKELSGQYDSDIREHMKKYAKGPADYRNEVLSSASNLARNIAFELLVASKVVSADIGLDFSIKSDIAAKFDRRSILFECKRPQSEQKLEANVRDAFKQLERKYKNPIRVRHRGIIAIDISKLLNPDFMLYVQPNAASLERGLSYLVGRFIEKHERLWQVRRSKKTIAVLVRVGIMAINQERDDMLTYCQQFGITPINTSGSRNIETARRLTEAMSSTR